MTVSLDLCLKCHSGGKNLQAEHELQVFQAMMSVNHGMNATETYPGGGQRSQMEDSPEAVGMVQGMVQRLEHMEASKVDGCRTEVGR